MPTLEHNALVDMFRERPELAPHFLATLFHADVPPHASTAVVEASLDQLIPVELRADLVLELRDANGALVLAIVVEVQRDRDPDKKFSWPAYVAVVRAQKRCPTVVLVVAPHASVAAWAAEGIDLGLGAGRVQPWVLGPAAVPEITDPVAAEQEVELAVLSAMVHGNGPSGPDVIRAAVHALHRLDGEHAMVYFEVVWNVLRRPTQRALEAMIMKQLSDEELEPRPFEKMIVGKILRSFEAGEAEQAPRPFQKRIVGEIVRRFEAGETKANGPIEEVVKEALSKWFKLEGLREALLRLAGRAGIAFTEDDRARIEACWDVETIERWIENVLGAKTAADVFS